MAGEEGGSFVGFQRGQITHSGTVTASAADDGYLRTVANPEFAHDLPNMNLHRHLSHVELPANNLIRKPLAKAL
jgi:hypothetical protein